MTIEEFLLRVLQDKRNQRITNKELAIQSGLSQPHINKLLNGKRPLSGVSLENILLLFPEVRRVLEAHFCREGGSQAIAGDGGAAAVNGNATVNHAPPAQPPADALAAAVDAALAVAHDTILDDQRMCDACRTIALRHLRSAAKPS